MALERIETDIYIYTGTVGTYTDTDLRYSIVKERLSQDNNIVIEIAELVRDYINHTFDNDYLSTAVWVTTVTSFIDSDTNQEYESNGTQIINYLAVDGYGYFEEEINPNISNNALYSSNNLYIPENTSGKFPIFAEGVGKISIDNVDTQITDNGNSNQKIQYVTIPANSSVLKVYDTNDTTILKTINISNICEPKFTPYKVTFVNKYGAFQDIYFFKKSTETLTVTDDVYKANTINNATITYGKNEGQRERYNVNGQTQINLNTGFVSEDFNVTIEELFLSENIWIRWENQTLPVIANSKTMNFKTSLNDKLINYTVGFEFAFNKINNVR